MAILIREFQSPDEEMKKIVLKVYINICVYIYICMYIYVYIYMYIYV
jgi:hypothetical protein